MFCDSLSVSRFRSCLDETNMAGSCDESYIVMYPVATSWCLLHLVVPHSNWQILAARTQFCRAERHFSRRQLRMFLKHCLFCHYIRGFVTGYKQQGKI